MKKTMALTSAAILLACVPMYAKAGDISETKEAIAWLECLRNYADRHSPSSVDAETVATAAIGNCRAEDQDVLTLISRRPTALRFVLGPLTRQERDDIREEHERVREGLREGLVSRVLENRLSSMEDVASN